MITKKESNSRRRAKRKAPSASLLFWVRFLANNGVIIGPEFSPPAALDCDKRLTWLRVAELAEIGFHWGDFCKRAPYRNALQLEYTGKKPLGELILAMTNLNPQKKPSH